MIENGKLVTDRYFAHRKEDTINVELDLQEINTQELIGVAIAEMKKHRAFGTFYNEQSLTAEEIPEIPQISSRYRQASMRSRLFKRPSA